MKNFVIAFHVCCETKEQAHQWQMSALQILDQNTHALGYKPDETGDLNCHCSGHADEENGEEEIPPPIPAPVVSTAAPEPPIEMIAGTHNKKEDAASASPQSARDRTEPTGQPEPVSRCNLQSSELAPESYKPEAVAKQTVSTVFPVQQTAVSFSPFFAPAGPEKLKHTNCDQNDCAACEVPLPEGVCGQKANSDSADVVLSQGNASGCTAATTWAIGSTLTEATIRPIPQPPCSECATLEKVLDLVATDELFIQPADGGGWVFWVNVNDMFYPAADGEGIDLSEIPAVWNAWKEKGWPGVVRWVQEKRSGLELRKSREETILNIENMRIRAEKAELECATLQEKLEIAQRYGQREYAIEQILRGDLATAVTECATLRKERDEAKRKLAVILDHSVRHDSYGVFGSDFSTCLFCDGGSSPGGVIFKHTDTCIVVTEKLESIVDDVFGELDENRRQLSAAEAQLSTLEKWFMDHWNEIDRAGIYDRDLIRAALAPTPEIAPEGKL